MITSSALLIGIEFHHGLNMLYATGEDGIYNLEVGLDGVADNHAEHADQYQTEEHAAKGLSEAQMLVTRWHKYLLDPEAVTYEYREYQVAVVDDEPFLELQLEMPLNNGGIFTARIDQCTWHRDKLCPQDYKSSAVAFARKKRDAMGMSGQITGHQALLRHHYPDQPIGASIASVCVKNPAKKPTADTVKPVERGFHSRSEQGIEKFLRDLSKQWFWMTKKVEEFDAKQRITGYSPWHALDITFNRTPPEASCMGNFNCDYQPICSLALQGADEKLLTTAIRQGYRARSPQ